ncbi:MAG: hypothetical protein KatS3mg110_1189 [Pirellulaceae bacterium]|nr:MAG: hypothetical protein KatS3mg110_1189 [Pirellulaceae bacterium]
MLGLATHYLLIALVLVCPYFCMGDGAAVQGAAREVYGCCPCGEHASQPHQPPAPCECRWDCLCRGAVADGGSRLTGAAAEMAVAWFGGDPTEHHSTSNSAYLDLDSPHQFFLVFSGRDSCALKCAWLL